MLRPKMKVRRFINNIHGEGSQKIGIERYKLKKNCDRQYRGI